MGKQEPKDGAEDKKDWLLFVLLALFVILMVIGYGWVIINIFSCIVPGAEAQILGPGSFGDAFGVINTLFSGLAFAGVIYAIILQKKELALQREELKETRKELARSAAAQEKSEKALADQVKVAAAAARLQSANQVINHFNGEITRLNNALNSISEEKNRNKIIEDLTDAKEQRIDISNQIVVLYEFLKETQMRGKVDE